MTAPLFLAEPPRPPRRAVRWVLVAPGCCLSALVALAALDSVSPPELAEVGQALPPALPAEPLLAEGEVPATLAALDGKPTGGADVRLWIEPSLTRADLELWLRRTGSAVVLVELREERVERFVTPGPDGLPSRERHGTAAWQQLLARFSPRECLWIRSAAGEPRLAPRQTPWQSLTPFLVLSPSEAQQVWREQRRLLEREGLAAEAVVTRVVLAARAGRHELVVSVDTKPEPREKTR